MHSLKHAVRALAKSPALVLVAVITLALGVGATTAIFSVVDAVVLRPLPFPDGDRLAFLGNKRVTSKNPGNAWSWPNFADGKEQSRSIPDLAAFYGGTFTLTSRGEARRLDVDVPVDLKTLDDYMRQSVAQRRLTARLLLLFAGVALLMALVGVYGVVSYGVTQRVHELSVRAALGAKPVQLVRLIIQHGLLLAGLGVLVGAGCSAIVTRFFAGLLYGVPAGDPVTFAAVGAILLGVTAIASFIPARRAARLDPMTILRKE